MFIILNSVDPSMGAVRVQVANILTYGRSNGMTQLTLVGGVTWLIDETPEQIDSKLKESYVFLKE